MTALEIHPPTPGRIVIYRLADADVDLIAKQRLERGLMGNSVRAGEHYPAMVVRTFGGDAVNLQVHLDGEDTYWATSRKQGEAAEGKTPLPGTIPPGTWCWPPRV